MYLIEESFYCFQNLINFDVGFEFKFVVVRGLIHVKLIIGFWLIKHHEVNLNTFHMTKALQIGLTYFLKFFSSLQDLQIIF
jgi:hypothetical protein